jgi:hypothetical protein
MVDQRSPSFGIGTVDHDAYLEAGSRVLVNHDGPPALGSGTRVRLMDVRVEADADGIAMVQSLAFSEAYAVDRWPETS